jgi:hypothetical protein
MGEPMDLENEIVTGGVVLLILDRVINLVRAVKNGKNGKNRPNPIDNALLHNILEKLSGMDQRLEDIWTKLCR